MFSRTRLFTAQPLLSRIGPRVRWRSFNAAMNIDGSNPTRVTTVPGQEAYPAWGNTPPSHYNLWKTAHFAANATNATLTGDSADPDADGLGNLAEYALGGGDA